MNGITIGEYLSKRLSSLKIKDFFAVPGDYNLVLLDEIIKNKSLNMINCCNELNASYAADGYARVNGLSAMVVTFGVGGLSAINGIAGAYAENLPVIIISGAPNTNSLQRREIVHHTTGLHDHSYIRRMFSEVCCHTECIISPEQAPIQIDRAINEAVSCSKPVYIDICCNIANAIVPDINVRNFINHHMSDELALKDAIKAIHEKVNKAVKPVIVVGSGCRNKEVSDAVAKLSSESGIAFATMPDAKGFLSEEHPNYMGHYWGPGRSTNACEIVESSDCYLFVGANINDYTTSGYRNNISVDKLIQIDRMSLQLDHKCFTRVYINDVITGLHSKIKKNDAALVQFKKLNLEQELGISKTSVKASTNKISRQYLYNMIESKLTKDHLVLAETGDSWFNGLDLKLPNKCGFEIQMQYGSIGWSVGALLGVQAALNNKKRVVGLIGDGSFQMTAQELSTMIRYKLKPIIFLINNASYGIEVQIHDGPYNVINNWSYAELVEVFRGNNMKAKSVVVSKENELQKAVNDAFKDDTLYLIEVKLDQDDCNHKLLQWGKYVADYNSSEPLLK